MTSNLKPKVKRYPEKRAGNIRRSTFSYEKRCRYWLQQIAPGETDEKNVLLDPEIARKRQIIRSLPLFEVAVRGGDVFDKAWTNKYRQNHQDYKGHKDEDRNRVHSQSVGVGASEGATA